MRVSAIDARSRDSLVASYERQGYQHGQAERLADFAMGSTPQTTPAVEFRAPGESPPPTTAEIRDWAREHGFTVKDRGRIPADVTEAFNARMRFNARHPEFV
jgi:hypothetical protein